MDEIRSGDEPEIRAASLIGRSWDAKPAWWDSFPIRGAATGIGMFCRS
ncbi:hypothetical protein [Amycolatopsis sp. WAC 04182]|nr:hypothetical protein [Amycolatopsis sp. WAC 04182]